MKRIILPLLLLLIIIALLIFKFTQAAKVPFSVTSPFGDNPRLTIITKPSALQDVSNSKEALFVSYWGIGTEKIRGYDELIYFGILANEKGIDKKDKGYTNISQFLKITNKAEKKFLTVRMTDSKINSLVLEDKSLQSRIIDESIDTAKDSSFDGIVLDFELSSLSFESVIKKINSFVENYYSSVQQNNLIFKIAIYGDTFYRFRPYDVKFLGEHADEILIMAYDFHKARENPGPNFPLNSKETYGYDFSKMIDDFLKAIPRGKLTVIFGLYGYDWIVDNKSQAVGQAEALSLEQIKTIFLNKCSFKDCLVARDQTSAETKITYTDDNSQKHVIWFEDIESIRKKKEFLRAKGIYSTALWAYSYF